MAKTAGAMTIHPSPKSTQKSYKSSIAASAKRARLPASVDVFHPQGKVSKGIYEIETEQPAAGAGKGTNLETRRRTSRDHSPRQPAHRIQTLSGHREAPRDSRDGAHR